MPSVSHLTSCTPTKSSFNLSNSLAVAVSEPTLYSLLTLQVPNLMSLFRYLCRKISVQVQCFLCEDFVTWCDLRWEVVSTSPNPQAEG